MRLIKRAIAPSSLSKYLGGRRQVARLVRELADDGTAPPAIAGRKPAQLEREKGRAISLAFSNEFVVQGRKIRLREITQKFAGSEYF